MPSQAEALSYAVRLSVLLKYFGQLCLVVVALGVFPIGVSLLNGETVQEKDEVVILTHGENLTTLRDRWEPSHNNE